MPATPRAAACVRRLTCPGRSSSAAGAFHSETNSIHARTSSASHRCPRDHPPVAPWRTGPGVWAVPTFPHRGLQYCGLFSNSGSSAILAAMRRASSRVARLAAVRLPVSVLLDYPGQSHFQHPKLVEILATIFTCPVGGDRTPVRSCVEMSY